MRTPLIAAFVIAFGLWQATTSSAQILIFGQDRRVNSSVFVVAEAETDADQLHEVAPDGGPFDVSLLTNAALPTATASATGIMNSVFTNTMLQASGEASGEATAQGTAIAYANAQSNVALRFSVEYQSDYTITGFVEGTPLSTATVHLARPFETLAFYNGSGGYLELNHTGTFEPGTYDFNITCGGGAAVDSETNQEGAASYSVVLQLVQNTSTPGPVVASTGLAASPNPFRANTRLTIPDGVDEVRVLDARGRLVRTLPGAPILTFDGRGETGQPLPSGVYWLRAIGPQATEVLKVVRVR